jgi:hypothetical protein
MKHVMLGVLGALVATPALAMEEPGIGPFGKLPKEIRALHDCASAKDKNIEILQEKYARSVVFVVTCPAKDGQAQIAVYVARDKKARGARRVQLTVLTPDGKETTTKVVPSAMPVREAYTKPTDKEAILYTRQDPPWLVGHWKPVDRPELCRVLAHWRLVGDKAELWLWEEAKECPSGGGGPKYEKKLDRKPPALVGR